MEQIKGKYRLEHLLGRGGMAEVFYARTIGAAGFSRPVAVKRILAGCSADAQFQAMFESEAKLTARLSHANVVSVLDFDTDESGRLFLVMEYVDGTDLDGLLHTGLLPLPVVLFLTKEILRGLGYAHDLPISDDNVRGLVHRDVSPQNVLIAWDGAVKVSDFGIAKARAATHASASMMLKGKVAYMSPEQANGAVLDGRSDLFAVGVMLWEMLCGASLFGRDSTLATLKAVLFDPIPSPRSRRPNVPDDIERVTMKLLDRDQESRFRNAEAAIAALGACAAFPKDQDGRELVSGLLIERIPDRAKRRSAELATRLEKPALARGSADADPAVTTIARPVQAAPAAVDPYRARAPRSRARRALPLALLGAVTALSAGLAVGAAAYIRAGGDATPQPAPNLTPTGPTVNHQPPREALINAPPSVLPPTAVTAPTTLHTVPAAPTRDSQALTALPQNHTPPRERQGHSASPKTRPLPVRDTKKADRIRVLNLRSSSWQ